MTVSKIEEVARAIMDCDAAGAIHHSAARAVARAAIEALRQPTPEMYHAAVMTHVHENGGIEHSPGLSWKAMIDEILKERT